MDTSEASQPLVGAVVFTREGKTLVVLHVAVREDYTQNIKQGGEPILLNLIEEVRRRRPAREGHRIRGYLSRHDQGNAVVGPMKK